VVLHVPQEKISKGNNSGDSKDNSFKMKPVEEQKVTEEQILRKKRRRNRG
jgi:hypothetical protein